MFEATNRIEQELHEIDEQEAVEFQQVFAVTDLKSAAEAQRRIAWCEDKKNEINSTIEEQIAPFQQRIDKIKAWGEKTNQEFAEKQAYYSNLLEQYLRNEVEQQIAAGKNPKKTISMPYGKISLKKQQPEFQKDNNQLLEYARDTGYVKVKEEVNWSELKKSCVVVGDKLIDENGETVPGVVVVEREEKFEVKLDC